MSRSPRNLSYSKTPEELNNFWQIRIRDPELFETIATPDWSSKAATKMAKQWIISDAIYDNSITPHNVPDKEIENILFIGNKKIDNVEAHARQGKLSGNNWTTQSILIPKIVSINKVELKIPEDIAGKIACYIACRLDKGDEGGDSPYCK